MIPEPAFEPGRKPEAELQKAVANAIIATAQERDIPFVLVKGSALDLVVLSANKEAPRVRMLELKAFVGARRDGVGFGDQKGQGAQVDLLWDSLRNRPRSSEELELVDTFVRWVLGYGLKTMGTARYAFFTCSDAQSAAMGGVGPRKQNNLKVSAFEGALITWSELIDRVTDFVFGSAS
jgi:hypothetical protein